MGPLVPTGEAPEEPGHVQGSICASYQGRPLVHKQQHLQETNTAVAEARSSELYRIHNEQIDRHVLALPLASSWVR